jgi:putative heme iron utilization protein
MIEHMNADHVESMQLYCQNFHQVKPETVHLVGVDSDGFDMEAIIKDDIKMLRVNFEMPIFDVNSARAAFVALAKAART